MMDATKPSGGPAPQSGFAGLAHWKHDALAGFQVALLWLPFSLGVALASGAPAVAGLISAIIAGLLYPFMGGSHVTVSGPAAALAPMLLWGMLTLGQGDLAVGYPLVLVAVVFTGILQLLLAALKAGRYASLLPVTVVEAMLAAIGIMIIIRQLPPLLGVTPVPSKTVLEGLLNLPGQLAGAQWGPALIGLLGLAVMFAFRRLQRGFWRWIPAAIVVSGMGAVLGYVMGLGEAFRIQIPDRLIDGLAFPAFAQLLASPDLWLSMLVVVLAFTMIDGVESVASVKAVDKIDPWRRKSDANRTLRAMGICNLTSGAMGGLTIIPNAVPSRANIDAGARTLWSNLYSGLFLLLFSVVLTDVLRLIPLASIAAVLIYIGWRLCEPAIFRHMAAIGRDRLLVFVLTVVAILLTDLLVGMLIGVLVEWLLLAYLRLPPMRWLIMGRLSGRELLTQSLQATQDMFRNPVIKHRSVEEDGVMVHTITLKSLLGFNTLQLEQRMAALPAGDRLVLHFTESAKLLDHSAMDFLHHLQEEAIGEGRSIEIRGLDRVPPFASHPLASRLQDGQVRQVVQELDERALLMSGLAQRLGLGFSPQVRSTLNREHFVYLRRGDQREERNVIEGVLDRWKVEVFDYSHTTAPDYHAPRRHTLFKIDMPDTVPASGVSVLVPGHYLERYLVDLEEVSRQDPVPGHRLYASSGQEDPSLMKWAQVLVQALGPVYLERRGRSWLVFAPDRAWETTERIDAFLNQVRSAQGLIGP